MILERWLMPDEVFPDFSSVTPELLRERGIRFIFSDIDNTLATYDDPTPPPDTARWLRSMEKAGIRVVFVSNNGRERVESFAGPAGCPAYWKARKPLVGILKRAAREAGASAEESLLLGDQLLTDAAAGKRCGMTVFIVPPIRDKTTLFWRIKRRIERPYMEKFARSRGTGRG